VFPFHTTNQVPWKSKFSTTAILSIQKQRPVRWQLFCFLFSLKFLFFNTDASVKLNRKKVSRQKIRARNLADGSYAHQREVSSPCARKENPEPALLRTGFTASRNVQFHTTASSKTSAFSQQLSVHTSEKRKKNLPLLCPVVSSPRSLIISSPFSVTEDAGARALAAAHRARLFCG